MLIDLLSANNYVNYNIKVAELVGLHPAIYLSELMNIQSKAEKKNMLNDRFFTLDRDYITARTTIDKKEQMDIEQNLLAIGILEIGNTADELSLNITLLTTLMMSTDEQLLENVKTQIAKSKKSQKKMTRTDAIKNALKQNITTSNEELREAYYEWIDEVYAKHKWLAKKSVLHAQEVVDAFSNHNLDVALRLIDIATRYACREMEWAIEKYNKEYIVNFKVVGGSNPTTAVFTPKPVNVSEEVF